jgi:hypothetical protein
VEKEEKVEKAVKPEMEKRPLYQSQLVLDFNSQ